MWIEAEEKVVFPIMGIIVKGGVKKVGTNVRKYMYLKLKISKTTIVV